MPQSLFERAGGFATVRKIVSSFYDKVLNSELVSGHFDGIDMRNMIDHQTKFISTVMGGPASYTDEALYRVHAHLHITRAEFVEIAELLQETLEDFELDRSDIDYIVAEFAKRERHIVAQAE